MPSSCGLSPLSSVYQSFKGKACFLPTKNAEQEPGISSRRITLVFAGNLRMFFRAFSLPGKFILFLPALKCFIFIPLLPVFLPIGCFRNNVLLCALCFTAIQLCALAALLLPATGPLLPLRLSCSQPLLLVCCHPAPFCPHSGCAQGHMSSQLDRAISQLGHWVLLSWASGLVGSQTLLSLLCGSLESMQSFSLVE